MKKILATLLIAAVMAPLAFSQENTDNAKNDEVPATSVAEKEKIRRQELAVKAQKQIQEARALVLEGKNKEANEILDKALDKIPAVGEGKKLYDAVNEIRAEMSLIQARKAIEAKDWVEAKDKAEEALGYQEDNAEAKKIKLQTEEILSQGMPDGRPNPALSKSFVRRVNRVDSLIKQGQDMVATGQYDEAERLFKEAMAIDPEPDKSNDPYNKVAARELEKLQKKKREIAETARKAYEMRDMNSVRELWHENTRVQQINLADDGTKQGAPTPMDKGGSYIIQQKLRSIRISEVDFQQASIQDAMNFLTARSRENDPQRQGISFLVRDDSLSKARSVTISLRDVPLIDVLRYITQLADVKYRVEEQAVLIVPLNASTDVLVVREFTVRPVFMKVADTSATDDAATRPSISRRRGSSSSTEVVGEGDTAKKALMARGVRFDEGTTATYSAITGRLIVKNTQDQIDLIEELILADMADQGISKMVRIEGKFIEINQTDLDSLTANWYINDGIPFSGLYPGNSGSRYFFQTSSAKVQNTTVNNLPQSSLDNVLGSKPTEAVATSISPNSLSLRALLDNVGVAAMIQAISQKKSANLVTTPTIVVNPGAKGIVEVAREFIYPVEWEAPKIVLPTMKDGQISGIQATVSAWPSQFISTPRKVGVSISVTPQVDSKNQKISLELEPNVVDFDGFIDYGSRIYDTITGGIAVAGNENKIQAPVFTVRSYENVRLDVRDGFTMVVGGLMKEDIQTIEDKVPVLGDIPVLGRAFRSKVERSIRKNNLLFVTPRILGPNGQPLNPFAGEEPRAAAAN